MKAMKERRTKGRGIKEWWSDYYTISWLG